MVVDFSVKLQVGLEFLGNIANIDEFRGFNYTFRKVAWKIKNEYYIFLNLLRVWQFMKIIPPKIFLS